MAVNKGNRITTARHGSRLSDHWPPTICTIPQITYASPWTMVLTARQGRSLSRNCVQLYSVTITIFHSVLLRTEVMRKYFLICVRDQNYIKLSSHVIMYVYTRERIVRYSDRLWKRYFLWFTNRFACTYSSVVATCRCVNTGLLRKTNISRRQDKHYIYSLLNVV